MAAFHGLVRRVTNAEMPCPDPDPVAGHGGPPRGGGSV